MFLSTRALIGIKHNFTHWITSSKDHGFMIESVYLLVGHYTRLVQSWLPVEQHGIAVDQVAVNKLGSAATVAGAVGV